MKKISIFLSSLDGGGAERVMLNLATGFSQRGFQVDLVLGKKTGPYVQQIPPNITVIDFSQSRLINTVFDLSNYLSREQPLAVLSALEDTNIVAILAKVVSKSSSKLLVTVHNHLSRESANATSLKRRLVPYLIRWFYPYADAVVGVSEGVVRDLVDLGIPAQKTRTIYNPIVTSTLLDKLQEKPEHPWFSFNAVPVVIGVGRLTAQKDFASLIRAFALVRKVRQARLVILGEGEERHHLESLIHELGLSDAEVILPGFVSNPYCWMSHADVLVLSSAWEGFGNVLVEAMAGGTSVISTDCESGPREILDDGKYGALVPIYNPDLLASAILETLENPQIPKCLQDRASFFSLDAAIDRYSALLD